MRRGIVAIVALPAAIGAAWLATRPGPTSVADGPPTAERGPPPLPPRPAGRAATVTAPALAPIVVRVSQGERHVVGARVRSTRLVETLDDWDPGLEGALEATTDARGEAVVSVPPEWAVPKVAIVATSADGTASSGPARPAAPGDVVRLALSASGAVEGTVSGLAADEIRDARVYVHCPAWGLPAAVPWALDAEGRFRAGGVLGRATIVARAPRRIPSPTAAIEVGVGEVVRRDLLMGPPAAVARVRFLVGGTEPAPAGAWLQANADPSRGWTHAQVGEDGWAELGAIPGAALEVFAWPMLHPRDRRRLTTALRLHLDPETWPAGCTVAVPRAVAARVRARTTAGEPLAGLPLRLDLAVGQAPEAFYRSVSGVTDAAGTWDAGTAPAAVPAGDYVLVGPAGRTLWSGSLDATPQGIELVLDDVVPVRLRLVSRERVPARCDAVRASVEPRAGGTPFAESAFLDAAEATLWVPREAQAEAVLRIREPAGPPREVSPLPAGAFDVEPSPGSGDVVVEARDGDGEPLSGLVRLRRLDADPYAPRASGRIGPDGTGVVVALPPGPYEWSALLRPGRTATGRVDVIAGRTTSVSIR